MTSDVQGEEGSGNTAAVRRERRNLVARTEA